MSAPAIQRSTSGCLICRAVPKCISRTIALAFAGHVLTLSPCTATAAADDAHQVAQEIWSHPPLQLVEPRELVLQKPSRDTLVSASNSQSSQESVATEAMLPPSTSPPPDGMRREPATSAGSAMEDAALASARVDAAIRGRR